MQKRKFIDFSKISGFASFILKADKILSIVNLNVPKKLPAHLESFGNPDYIEPNQSDNEKNPGLKKYEFKDDEEPVHDYKTSENHFYPSSLYHDQKRGRMKSLDSEDTPAFN